MHSFSAHHLHQQFLQGELSAKEIIEATFKRIDRLDPKIGAFLSLFTERAVAKAEMLDEKRARKEKIGRLAAIPIAFKDNINVLGEKMTCGSQFLSNYTSVFDATVTRLIEEEDALIIGKTNMDSNGHDSPTSCAGRQRGRLRCGR